MADFDLDLDLDFDVPVEFDLDTRISQVSRELGKYDETKRSWATEAGPAVLAELVKSYGWKRNQNGSWDWSLENIGTQFKEHPIWTTLDYASILYAPAKFGLAAAGTARGARAVKAGAVVGRSALEKGLAGGRFAGKTAQTRMGRAFQKLGVSGELAAATEMRLAGPAKFAQGYFANPLTTHMGDDYLKLIDRYGAAPFEAKGVLASGRREFALAKAITQRETTDAIEAVNRMGLNAVDQRRVVQLLERGVPFYDDLVQASLSRAAKGKPDQLARMTDWYKRTLKWRQGLHDDLYELGFIDRSTYRRGLKGYLPRVNEEYEQILSAMDDLGEAAGTVGVKASAIKGGGGTIAQGGKARLMPRAETKAITAGPALREERNLLQKEVDKIKALHPEADDAFWANVPGAMEKLGRIEEIGEELEALYGGVKIAKGLTRILDPTIPLAKLGEAKMLVARAKFLKGIASSVIARTPRQVSAAIRQIATNPVGAKIHGLDPAAAEAIGKLVAGYDKLGLGADLVDEEIAKRAGWLPIASLLKSAGTPTFIHNLPKALRDKWVDPTVARDIVGMTKFMADTSKVRRFYSAGLSLFRASKTAYNPATGIRNVLGAQLFHHMVVGGTPKLPTEGYAAFRGATEWYVKGRELGVVGSSFHHEVREALEASFKSGDRVKKMFGNATALDFLGDSKFAKAMQAAGSKAERLYRSVDEVYKLDAFIRKSKQFMKAGMSQDDAMGRAMVEINKFMPSFVLHSPFADSIRSAIPFASFTTEALRIWKNALIEKPHMVFFWNHFVETLQEGSALMAGYSPEQLEEAHQALPHYLQGKKTLALPFNVDGRPQFIDMSYLIPLANLVEAEQPGSLFYDAVLDPTTNPFLGLAVAAATGKDPFSGRPIEPRFTERQLGIAVTDQRARLAVGLGEYMATVMVPPLMPPGYAGTNLLELARGQKHPQTGEPLEDGALKTILANVGAMRMYTPDVESQALNVRREEAMRGQSMTQAWKRYEFARANGDVETMLAEEERIKALRRESGFTGKEALDYFRKSAADRGAFSDLSKRQLKDIITRARKLGTLDPKSKRLMGELMAEYRGSRKRRRGR